MQARIFKKGKGTCKDCRVFLKRKVKLQPLKEEISSFYDYYVSKCSELFITDVEYQKLISDNDLKVWHSREMAPPLDKDILKFWREKILMGFVKNVLLKDEYEDEQLVKTFRRVWIVANH